MEEFRMKYPLDANSMVLDAGGFKGDFVDWCIRRWGCKVHSFEPIKSFYDGVRARFATDSRVRVHNFGLSDANKSVQISVRGDSSSIHLPGDVSEAIELRDVVEEFDALGLGQVDLFKINIEGGEYQLMPRLIDSGLVRRVRFFQVQYHGYGDYDPTKARDDIRAALAKTHVEEWCVGNGQWESWARRA